MKKDEKGSKKGGRKRMKLAGSKHFEVIDSTSSWALRELEEGAFSDDRDLPFLVTADLQTAGRGQKSRTWHSPRGALMFSLIFDPKAWNIPLSKTPFLGFATALAILDTMRLFLSSHDAARFRIRWPNDVFYDTRKVSGILLEGHSSGRMTAGVGINLFNTFRDAPSEVRDILFSVLDIDEGFKTRCTLNEYRESLLRHLDVRYTQIAAHSTDIVRETDALCFQKGRTVTMQSPQGPVSGKCTGLSPSGALLVDDKPYYSGTF